MKTPMTARERKLVSLSCAVPVLAALTVLLLALSLPGGGAMEALPRAARCCRTASGGCCSLWDGCSGWRWRPCWRSENKRGEAKE